MIRINCDVGEGVNNEEALFPYIYAASVAFGGHAGDAESVNRIIHLAKKHEVKIGAHPSYPDKENFGRKVMDIHQDALLESIKQQIHLVASSCAENGIDFDHIKPHGALYHELSNSESLAQSFIKMVKEMWPGVSVYAPYRSSFYSQILQSGIRTISEGFADRRYNDHWGLVSRKEEGAVLSFQDAVQQVEDIVRHQSIEVDEEIGMYIKAEFDTICVHSDSADAVEIVQSIHEKYKDKYLIRYKDFGGTNLLMQWPDEISEDILKDVLNFQKAFEEFWAGIHITQSFNSLCFHFRSTPPKNIAMETNRWYMDSESKHPLSNRVHEIPVCYETEFSSDLAEVARHSGLSKEEVIELHTSPTYRVYGVGFLPGFLYLGGMDKRISTPRKATPSMKVPKGAVAIGGNQTGIYPQESPGGWNVIGRTYLNLFDKNSDEPSFAQAGDLIKFIRISRDEYLKGGKS